MKKWSRGIEIHASIEKVWELFDGSLENMQKIMPQVVEHRPVTITENKVGSVHRQKYKEGNRIQEYDVKTLTYINENDEKKLKVEFKIANMFKITALYELVRINDRITYFGYTVTNNPVKWYMRLFMIFTTANVVVQFIERVKYVAENE